MKPVKNDGRECIRISNINECLSSDVADKEHPDSQVVAAEGPYEKLCNRNEEQSHGEPVAYEQLK